MNQYQQYADTMRKIADVGYSAAILQWDNEVYLLLYFAMRLELKYRAIIFDQIFMNLIRSYINDMYISL